MTTNVALLPEKWRQFAEVLRGMKGGRNYRVRGAGIVAAAHIDDCADELAAALATQPKDGELLELSQRLANQANCEAPPVDDLLLEAATTLRTLASRRVTVDDAMVERGLLALERRWGWKPQNDGTRDEVHAILTAAMQPDSGEV